MKCRLFQKLMCAVVAAMVVLPAFGQFGGGATRPQVAMPEGPLRDIILKNCVSCHGIDDYAFNALSKERWSALLTEMHESVKVNELKLHENELMLEYLATTFGTESVPFPREYIPPEITTYFADAEGREMLDVVCMECHELDRVYETRASLPRWRVLVVEMRQRGAYLPDDVQMEQLIEWLSRVQSANLFE